MNVPIKNQANTKISIQVRNCLIKSHIGVVMFHIGLDNLPIGVKQTQIITQTLETLNKKNI